MRVTLRHAKPAAMTKKMRQANRAIRNAALPLSALRQLCIPTVATVVMGVIVQQQQPKQ